MRAENYAREKMGLQEDESMEEVGGAEEPPSAWEQELNDICDEADGRAAPTPAAEDVDTVRRRELRQEALHKFRAWLTYAGQIKWDEEFPGRNIPKNRADIKPMEHLIGLPVGKMYLKIFETDPLRNNFGYLPYMAICSKGQIGALQAESFCERVFSIAKGVINDGNTGLDDDYIDKVTTLRANERFMKFMKENHHDEVFAVACDGGLRRYEDSLISLISIQ